MGVFGFGKKKEENKPDVRLNPPMMEPPVDVLNLHPIPPAFMDAYVADAIKNKGKTSVIAEKQKDGTIGAWIQMQREFIRYMRTNQLVCAISAETREYCILPYDARIFNTAYDKMADKYVRESSTTFVTKERFDTLAKYAKEKRTV